MCMNAICSNVLTVLILEFMYTLHKLNKCIHLMLCKNQWYKIQKIMIVMTLSHHIIIICKIPHLLATVSVYTIHILLHVHVYCDTILPYLPLCFCVFLLDLYEKLSVHACTSLFQHIMQSLTYCGVMIICFYIITSYCIVTYFTCAFIAYYLINTAVQPVVFVVLL